MSGWWLCSRQYEWRCCCFGGGCKLCVSFWNAPREAAGVSLPTEHFMKQGSRLALSAVLGWSVCGLVLTGGTSAGSETCHCAVVCGAE